MQACTGIRRCARLRFRTEGGTTRRMQPPARSGGIADSSSTRSVRVAPPCVSMGDGSPNADAASRNTARLRVAVDVDEVLGRFVFALNIFCRQRYGMEYSVEDFTQYDFSKIWQCEQQQANEIVHAFFESDHFNDGIPVIPGAIESLSRLSTTCDLVVVTSRQHVVQDATLEWLDRHYTGLFNDVYFGNHFALEGTSRKKSEICLSIGAHVLIDDNPGYALDCSSAGINVLLYDWNDSYAWSKLPDLDKHPLIRKVTSWTEVEAAVEAMLPAQSQNTSRSRAAGS